MIKSEFRAHKTTIFNLIRSYWLVLTAPVVRVVIQYMFSLNFKVLLPLEVFMVLFVLLMAVLGWYSIKIGVSDKIITIKRGVLIKSQTKIDISKVVGISIKQNALDSLFGCAVCFINTKAEKEDKKWSKIRLGVRDAKRLCNVICEEKLMPLATQRNLKRFLTVPLVVAMAIVVFVLVKNIFFSFGVYDLLATITFTVLDVYYSMLCYKNYKNAKISIRGNVQVEAYQGLSFRKLCCSKSGVGIIKILQNPFDIRFRTCKIKITMFGESGDSVKIKHVYLNDALAEINQNFNLNKSV